jgi:hypothetical protein
MEHDVRAVIIDQMPDYPFENLPQYADDFFNAIGRAVLMWGKLEQAFDNLLLTAINVEARKSPRREMEFPLSRKLTSLKNVYSSCASLSPLASRAHDLAERIRNQGDDRHLVVHSTWMGFEDGPPPKIVLKNVKNNRGNFLVQEAKPTFDMLAQIVGAFAGARKETLNLLLDTNAHLDPRTLKAALAQGTGRQIRV